jgi:predicted RNase H-like nuclease (RuvC/YqgF family)
MTKTNKDSNNRERLIVLEEHVAYIKRDVTELKSKLDDFINSADVKYATKKEVCDLHDRIRRREDNKRSWNQWIPPLIISLLLLIMEAIKTFGG